MTPASSYKVVVADDHPVVRIGVRNILAAVPEFQIAGECSDGEAALHMVRSVQPDLLILDLAMPKMSGIEVLRALRATNPTLKTLVLAATVDRRQTLEILQLGARGILLKDVVAERLGLSLRSVRRLIARGELPVHRLGRAVRISEDDLVRFLAAHRHA